MSEGRRGGLWDGVHAAFHRPGTVIHARVQGFVAVLIGVSIALLIGHMIWPRSPDSPLELVDRALVVTFALELSLRLLSYRPPKLTFYEYEPVGRVVEQVGGRLRFLLTSPLNLIDLICVLEVVHPALRGLRVVRTLRLLRTMRRVPGFLQPLVGLERGFVDNRYLFGLGFALVGASVLLGGSALWLIEREHDGGIQTLGDGIWWALVTLTTVGYGDITPTSSGLVGRLIAGSLMIAGMVSLALFAGIVTNTLLGSIMLLRTEQFRMSETLDHIVVCGYGPGAEQLLRALEDELDLHAHEVVLFADAERPSSLPVAYRWVQGDPTREADLERARIAWAKAVIVVASRSNGPQVADAITILTGFTLRRYLAAHERTSQRRRPVYLLAEILEHENVEHAASAGFDEVIETTRLGFSLLSHAVNFPGTATLMGGMACAEGQNVYVGAVPASLRPADDARLTFGALAAALSSQQMLLLGLRSADGTDRLNLPQQEPVPDGAGAIYIATRPQLPPFPG